MRRNLLKITCLFLCFSCLTTASVYGQWSKKKRRNAEPPQETPQVEILDNNPQNAENLHFLFSPFYWNAQNALDLNVRLEAYYRKNNEWSIGGFLAKSYTFEESLIERNLESPKGIQKPIRIGVTGDYFFHNKKKKREYKIIVKSEDTGYRTTTHYYVPVNGYEYHFLSARGGYTLLKGSAAASYQAAPENEILTGALPNVTEGTLHIGISRMKIFRMKAGAAGAPYRAQKLIRYMYLDLLLNAHTFYNDDFFYSNRDSEIIDTWEKIPVGVRFGYKRFPSRKFDYHITIEFGIKPGTVHNTDGGSSFGSGSFLNIGFGYGLGMKI